jgi:hypothetical protein
MRSDQARRVAAQVAWNQLEAELEGKKIDPSQVSFQVDRESGISLAEAGDAFDRALDDARKAFHPDGMLGRVARVLDFTPHALHKACGYLQKPLRWIKESVLAAARAVTSKRKQRVSDGAIAAASAVTEGARTKGQRAKDIALLPIRTVKGVLTWRPEDVTSKHVVEVRLPTGEVRKMNVEVDDLALSIWLLRSSANACAIGGIPLPGTGAVSFLAAAIASGVLGVHRLKQGDVRGARACGLTAAKVGTLSVAIGGPIVAAYLAHHDLIEAAHGGLLIGLASDGLLLTMANSLGHRLDEIELGSDEHIPETDEPVHPPLELGVPCDDPIA